MLILDDSLVLNFSIDSFSTTNLFINIVHIKGFEVTSSIFKNIPNLFDNIIEFYFTRLEFYYQNSQINFCHQKENFTVFKNLQQIQFGITVKYFPNTCPLIFDGLNLFSLRFLGISNTLIKQNILSFIQVDNMSSPVIHQLTFRFYKFKLTKNLTSKKLFERTNSLSLIGSLEGIDSESLIIFKNLEELNLQLTNFGVLMSQNSAWLFIFLNNIHKKFNLNLIVKSSYDFPNADFCLYLYFPKNGSINPVIHLRNITCSCTIFWLLQNDNRLQSEYIIQMNRYLCNNYKNLYCNFSQMKRLLNLDRVLTSEVNDFFLMSDYYVYTDFPIKNTFENIFENSYNKPTLAKMDSGFDDNFLYFFLFLFHFLFNDIILFLSMLTIDLLLLIKFRNFVAHKTKILVSCKKTNENKLKKIEKFELRVTITVCISSLILFIFRAIEFGISLYVFLEEINGEMCKCNRLFGTNLAIGSPLESEEDDSSCSKTKNVDKKLELPIAIQTFRSELIIPYVLKCQKMHKICNYCLEQTTKIVCPICKGFDCKSDSLIIDQELLINSLLKNQKSCFETESKINEFISDKQIVNNSQNICDIISRFIPKCNHCKTNSENKNFAELFCFHCETIFCQKCCENDHRKHTTKPFGKINFKKDQIKCTNDKDNESKFFCSECLIFICGDCLAPDHLNHNFLSFFETEKLNQLLDEFECKMSQLKASNLKKYNKLKKKLVEIKELKDFTKAPNISRQIHEINQSNSIIDSTFEQLQNICNNPNFKLSTNTIDDKKFSLKIVLDHLHKVASSISNSNLKNENNKLLDSTFDSLSQLDVSYAQNDQHLLETPKLSPIENNSENDFDLNLKNVPYLPKKLNNRPKTAQAKVNNEKIHDKIMSPKPKTKTIVFDEKKPVSSTSPTSLVDINNNTNRVSLDLAFTDQEFEGVSSVKFNLGSFKSPSEFYIVPGTRIKKSKMIMERLNKSIIPFSNSEISELSKGSIVSYYYEASQVYRRAVIDAVHKTNEGFYFDIIGLEDQYKCTLQQDLIRKCPQDLTEIPPLTIKCCLKNLKPVMIDEYDDVGDHKSTYKWDSEVEPFIFDWLRRYKKQKIVKIMGKTEDDYYEVDFFIEFNEKDNYGKTAELYNLNSLGLCEILYRNKFATLEVFEEEKSYFNMFRNDLIKPSIVRMESLHVDSKTKAIISHFNTLDSFYAKRIHELDISDSMLFKLYRDLNAFYRENSQGFRVYGPEVNMPVAALFKDGEWHRAEIVDISPLGKQCDVLFVDYGNIEKVNTENICYLKREFMADEIAVFKCKLFGLGFQDKTSFENAQDCVFNIFNDLLNSNNRLIEVHVKNTVEDLDKKLKYYEVIIRFNQENKWTNLNVYLTKMNMAECTDLAIYDGENLQENSKEKHMLKRAPVLTKLDKLAIDTKCFQNKVINSKPEKSILCKVTNAMSPDEIWLQDVVDSDGLYEQLHQNLNKKYTELIKHESFLYKSQREWKIDEICVMKKSRRDDFYRVKIVGKTSTKYNVICLDTGLYENCESQFLFHLIDEFTQPDFMAKKCFLTEIEPAGTSDGKWSFLSQQFTNNTLTDQYVHVVFNSINKKENYYEVCIYINAKQKVLFNHEYFNSEYVKFSDILNMQGLAIITGRNKILDKYVSETNLRNKLGPVCTGTYKSNLPKKVYKNYQNNIEAHYDCLITDVGYLKEGKNDIKFYAWLIFTNLTNSFDLINEMKQNFQVYYDTYGDNGYRFGLDYLIDSVSNEKKEACVIKSKDGYSRGELVNYTSEDDLIKSGDGEAFRVRLVDLGTIEFINFDSIYKPIEKYINVEKQAFEVLIDIKTNTFDEAAFSEVKNSLCNKIAKVKLNKIVNTEDDDGSEGLSLNGDILLKEYKCYLSDLIINKSKHILNKSFDKNSKLEIPQSLNQQHVQINLTWIDDIDQVWIQFPIIENDSLPDEIRENSEKYAEIQDTITQLYHTKNLRNLKLEDIEPNKLCCSFFSQDLNVYRAVILSVNYFEKNAKVKYIDFGNEETVSFKDLFDLDDIFKEVPGQALCCKLRNVSLSDDLKLNEKNHKEFIEKFWEKVAELQEENLIFAKFFFDNQVPEIELYVNEPLTDKRNLLYKCFLDKNLIKLI
ncbi:unnamed protein product [Brachionus calyciflorus]|uniref:Uncharacterized protein n=1 Tax=Brachionus calyciflorus TaxID=104777 RepID=A0A813MQN2_9BILA|nr:unnamed protein product [Brachionus calyciflorus]